MCQGKDQQRNGVWAGNPMRVLSLWTLALHREDEGAGTVVIVGNQHYIANHNTVVASVPGSLPHMTFKKRGSKVMSSARSHVAKLILWVRLLQCPL